MMPSGNLPLSEDLVRELVKSLHESGKLAGLMTELETGSASAGSMSDASKRRLHSMGELEDEEFQMIPDAAPPSKKQTPILPGEQNKMNTLSTGTLPSGITSLSHWGKTVCELPKVAHLELSYEEMVDKAKGDTMIADYLKWAFTAGVKSEKVADLQAYLKARNWNPKTNEADKGQSELTYPGTAYVRRMK